MLNHADTPRNISPIALTLKGFFILAIEAGRIAALTQLASFRPPCSSKAGANTKSSMASVHTLHRLYAHSNAIEAGILFPA